MQITGRGIHNPVMYIANLHREITGMPGTMVIPKIATTIKTNKVTTITMKMVMAMTGVLKGMMIAGFTTMIVSIRERMVMIEEGNLKDITVAGSMEDFPSGTGKLLATDR
jgi:predicted transposase YdaD